MAERHGPRPDDDLPCLEAASLRDFFAGCALLGMMMAPARRMGSAESTATEAYTLADAMLNEREEEEDEDRSQAPPPQPERHPPRPAEPPPPPPTPPPPRRGRGRG